MTVKPLVTTRFPEFQTSRSQTLKRTEPKRAALVQDSILFQGQPTSQNNKGVLSKLKALLNWLFVKPFQWIFRKLGIISEQPSPSAKPATSETAQHPISEQNIEQAASSQQPHAENESASSAPATAAKTISNLHEAVEHGTLDELKTFIAQGNNLNSFDENGNTPLHIATKNGNISFVKALLDAGAQVLPNTHNEKTALHEATRNNHSEIVAHLLKHGADSNALTFAHETALHIASRKGHIATMKELLNSNINLNQVSKDTGDTALHIAVEEGQIEAVKLLLDRNPLLDIKNKDGQTPLELALQKEHTEIEMLLRSKQQQKP